MDFTPSTRGSLTMQRAAGIATAAMLHLALAGWLLQSETREGPAPELPPLQFRILTPPPPPQVRLPMIEAHVRLPSTSVPLPAIVIAEPAAPVAAVAAATVQAVPTRPVASTRPGTTLGGPIGDWGTAGMVRARMDMTRSPDSCRNPAFPPTEDREAYGLAAVSLLIGPDGRIQGSRIDASSGHPQLDQATIDSFGRCTYIRGTIRGRPAPTWYRIKWLWFLPRGQR